MRRITPLNLYIIREYLVAAEILLDYSESRPLCQSLFEIPASDYPLSLAVSARLMDIVKILLSYSANVTITDLYY